MINDKTYYVEQLIASSCVKYNKLSELIYNSYAGSQCTNINLYIDLNSVLRQLYSGDYWTYKSFGKFEIVATIINMCGHYRDFFRRIGVESTIYLIYGLNCPNANNTYVNGYNNKFINSYLKKPDTTAVINENLRVLNIISQYLPGIYYFNIGNSEVSSMIDYLINNVKISSEGSENLVISKDPLALQLIPEHNVRVLRPLKGKMGERSFIVDNSNLWQMFISNYRDIKFPKELISNNLFQNVLCMTTLPERSMYSVFSLTKVFKILSNGIKLGFIKTDQLYTQNTLNSVLSAMDVQCNYTDLEMRFRAISTHYQSRYILPIECPEIKKLRLINLEDVDGLKSIIAKYFCDNPIDLDKL